MTSLPAVPDDNTRAAPLLEQAVRDEWPIPVQFRPAIVNRQMHIAVDPSVDPRIQIAAARVLVAMNAQNLAARAAAPKSTTVNVHVAILDATPDERRMLLAALAERLRAGSLDDGPGAGGESCGPARAVARLSHAEGASGGEPA
jgi:hypothetical protein